VSTQPIRGEQGRSWGSELVIRARVLAGDHDSGPGRLEQIPFADTVRQDSPSRSRQQAARATLPHGRGSVPSGCMHRTRNGKLL
jgi:hypothetical protein